MKLAHMPNFLYALLTCTTCPCYLKAGFRLSIPSMDVSVNLAPRNANTTTVHTAQTRGVHQLVWVKSKRVSPGLYSQPPLIGSVMEVYSVLIEQAYGEVVMCHAPLSDTFLEKGWIEEIFNRNRENNKEMNRDNKINRDSYIYSDS